MTRWNYPRTFFSRTLISFAIILVAVILTLSTVLYAYIQKVVSKTEEENNRSILSQISYSANYMHETAKNLAFTIYNDPQTIPFMYQEKIEPTDLLQEINQIRQWAGTNPFVYSIYVYNNKMNTYISSIGSDTGEPANQFFDTGIIEIMKRIGTEPKGLFPVPRKVNLDLGDIGQKSQVSVFTYIVFELLSKEKGVEGAVVINMKAEYLRSIIHSLQAKNNLASGNIVIVDAKGKAVADFDSVSVNENMSEQTYVRKIIQDGGDSGSFRSMIDGEEMLVTYVKSGVMGWHFIHTVPLNTIYEPLKKIKTISILVCLMILCSGLLATFLVSRKIYLPIGELVGKIANLTKSQQDPVPTIKDEASFLSQTFSETFQKVRFLDSEDKQRKKNEMLSNLLMQPGQLTMETIYPAFLKHQVAVDPSRPYIMILMKIDHFAAFSLNYSLKDQTLFRYAHANITAELLSPRFKLELIDMGLDHLVGLLNPVEEPEAEDLLELGDIIKQIQHWSSENLKLSFSAVIGSHKENILEMNKAYQELSELTKYRFIFGHECLIETDMLLLKEAERHKLPSHLEDKLLESLATGNLENVNVHYSEIVELMQAYSYQTVMSMILHLIYLINNKVVLLESNSPTQFSIDFHSFTRDVSAAETLQEVNKYFEALFVQITDAVNRRMNHRGQLIVDNVINLIEANFTDPALCLDSIAQIVKLSNVYLGKLFRDAMGQSVADYITEVRIRHVIKLMHHKNVSLSEMMEQVGIENQSYFYKQFKKKTGVSFSDYKLKHLKGLSE